MNCDYKPGLCRATVMATFLLGSPPGPLSMPARMRSGSKGPPPHYFHHENLISRMAHCVLKNQKGREGSCLPQLQDLQPQVLGNMSPRPELLQSRNQAAAWCLLLGGGDHLLLSSVQSLGQAWGARNQIQEQGTDLEVGRPRAPALQHPPQPSPSAGTA